MFARGAIGRCNLGGGMALALRRASPTCVPINAPTGAASRAARAATPVFPGWTPGMPCGTCLRGHPTGADPLRALCGRLGVGLPACGARPPLCVGSLREARRAACGTLAGTVATSRRRRCIPVASLPSFRWPSLSPFGRPHIRSALTAVTSQPLRCAACPCRVGVRLAALPPRSCRCVPCSPRLRLGGACKAGGARRRRLPTGLRPRSGSGAGAP